MHPVMRLVEVRPGEGYRLWLRYEDGTEGTVDLSDLGGRGVFEAWENRGVFEAVQITNSGALEWPGDIDLCGDALYLRLTGRTPEDVFRKLGTAGVDA